jgi:hypothetical protein
MKKKCSRIHWSECNNEDALKNLENIWEEWYKQYEALINNSTPNVENNRINIVN